MKIIFSRKGFDSAAGGVANPMIGDQSISLPIPYKNARKTFDDVGFGRVVADLTGGKITGAQSCHFDPDLEMGAFGQADAAQGHLRNQKVGEGDLFLFFGWFREAQKINGMYKYVEKAPDYHRIFGWFQIGEIIDLDSNSAGFARECPQYAEHPHVTDAMDSNNTLYLAKRHLELDGFDNRTIPGFGKFRASPATLLSNKTSGKRSLWDTPEWLNPNTGGCGMTYHPKIEKWGTSTVQTAGRGQEFVAKPDADPRVSVWLHTLFESRDG